jgi:hypothetical protein
MNGQSIFNLSNQFSLEFLKVSDFVFKNLFASRGPDASNGFCMD